MNDYSSKGTLEAMHQTLEIYEGKRFDAVEQNDIKSVRRWQRLINEMQSKMSDISQYQELKNRIDSGERSDKLKAEIEDFEDYALDNNIWTLYDQLEILKSHFALHLFEGWIL